MVFIEKSQLHTKWDTKRKGYNNLEILFVEIGGINIPSLICVAYQPSSKEIEKLEWLGNFENILAGLYFTWKDVFIVTDDFYIDLLREQMELTRRYKKLLHNFLYKNTSQKLQEKSH